MTLAERLAAFTADLRFEDLPPAVVASVRLRALDVLGIALAASGHEVGPPLRDGLESWAGRGDCTVIGAKFNSTFPRGFPGWVRLRLADGRTLEAREPDGRGGTARPLPEAAIVDKFRANASRVLPAARVVALERAALALDTLGDVRMLMQLCRAS